MVTNACLIVGASSDIGCELVAKTSREPGTVYATYHSSTDRLPKASENSIADIVPIRADLADPKSVDRLLEQIETKGVLPQQIVFLAAPRLTFKKFAKLTLHEFQAEWNVQVSSTFQILHGLLPKIAKQKLPARIVIMLSSVVMDRAPNGLTSYTSAKYALLGLMKSLSSEYAGRNINVNALSPSFVETRYLDSVPSQMVELAAQNHPKGRNATVDDIVPSILFLLSDQADYISGVNLPIVGV